MQTVLIVDDELNICHLVQHLIEWEALELQCIGVVTDSSEAYRFALEKRPDIIITDIQMPGMTGLELIEKLQEKGLDCKYIIFTGYKTFDYAYKAIKFGCNDFLLKPINKAELNDSLHNICLSSQPSNHTAGQSASQNPKTLLRRQLLSDIAHNELSRKITDVDTLNAHFGYRFKGFPMQIGMLWLTHGSFPEGFRTNILYKLARALQAKMKPVCTEFEITTHQGDVSIIMSCPEGAANEKLTGFLQKASEIIEPYPFLNYVLGLGKLADSPQKLIHSCHSAKQAVASRVMGGYNCIIDANSVVLKNESYETPPSNQAWKDIDLALDILDTQRLSEAIRLLCGEATEYFKHNPAMVFIWYKNAASTIFNTFTENHADYQQMTKQDFDTMFAAYENCADIESLTAFLVDTFSTITGQYLGEKNIHDSKTIQIAKTYICENLSRRLELDDVANQVFLSSTYFGILFKKETGTTFSEYLFEKRMEKAKEYLQELRYNINEIANMVGYKDTKYFSRQFKKCFGINPDQYRKIHHFQYKG